MLSEAFFRVYGKLSDFLKKSSPEKEIAYKFQDHPAVKDAIEAMGIPHPEVGLIVINNRPASFSQKMMPLDSIEIYPHHGQPPGLEEFSLPFMPEGIPTFILDVHLGRLARYMRAAGLDSLYERSDRGDEYISGIAALQNRILLTCDTGLLKRSSIIYGYRLRSRQSRKQFREVVDHFRLKKYFKPFSRCASCNGLIMPVAKGEVVKSLPAGIKRDFDEFFRCSECGKVYWQGSHYKRISELLADL